MIYYFDTSALVKKYILEQGTERVVDLFEHNITAATSILTYPEMLSGIGRKRREGYISDKDFRTTLSKFEADWMAFFIIEFHDALLPVQRRLSNLHSLKGADLVHISSLLWMRDAAHDAVTLVASDMQLLQAAKLENVEFINPELR